jgi:hypothetical protein
MAKIKPTKAAVDAAQSQAQAVELRDTLVPGFLCKISPAGSQGAQGNSQCSSVI